jgi:hypothetical protein
VTALLVCCVPDGTWAHGLPTNVGLQLVKKADGAPVDLLPRYPAFVGKAALNEQYFVGANSFGYGRYFFLAFVFKIREGDSFFVAGERVAFALHPALNSSFARNIRRSSIFKIGYTLGRKIRLFILVMGNRQRSAPIINKRFLKIDTGFFADILVIHVKIGLSGLYREAVNGRFGEWSDPSAGTGNYGAASFLECTIGQQSVSTNEEQREKIHSVFKLAEIASYWIGAGQSFYNS